MKKIFIGIMVLIVMSIGLMATLVAMNNDVETEKKEVSRLEFVVKLVFAGATDIDIHEDTVSYTTKYGYECIVADGFYEFALEDLKEQ